MAINKTRLFLLERFNLPWRRIVAALALSILAFTASPSFAQDGDSKKQDNDKPVANDFELDKTQEAPIFIYDISGGMQLVAVAKRTPHFQLFADGRVKAGGNPGIKVMDGQLTPAELQKFLKLVVTENDIYGIDQDALTKKIKEGKAKLQLADAPFTKFSIDIKKGKKAVSVYALFNAVRNFPKMDELIRLKRIEKQTSMISAKIHLGTEADEVLKAVNEAVKNHKEHDLKPFTADQLVLATRLANGSFQVRYSRKGVAPGPRPPGAAPLRDQSAIYFRTGETEKPKVSFYGLPHKK